MIGRRITLRSRWNTSSGVVPVSMSRDGVDGLYLLQKKIHPLVIAFELIRTPFAHSRWGGFRRMKATAHFHART